MAESIRTAVIYPLPIPYHHRLFELVADDPAVNLTVFFCREKQVGRGWAPTEVRYPHRFLPNYGLAVQRRDMFAMHFSPSIMIELWRGQFDVIVISGLNHPTMQLAMAYALITRVPYVFWNESHHIRPHLSPWYVRFVKRILYRPLLARSAGCLVTGTHAREYFVSYGGRADRTFVVANTTDVFGLSEAIKSTRFEAEKLKKELGIAGKRIILYVGRLAGVKGLSYLVDAIAVVRRARQDTALVLVGSGPLRSELETSCRKYGLQNVVFVGFKQPPELPAYYGLADVFVLPSLYEPWGTVINEALAAGLPVVVTRTVGAAGDLVRQGENGYIVPEADSRALAHGILAVIGDEVTRKRMAQRSQEIVSSWTHEASARAFVEAVRTVWNDGRAAGRRKVGKDEQFESTNRSSG
jgi:glycosyltransferase involved in cell wall biosynthesis